MWPDRRRGPPVPAAAPPPRHIPAEPTTCRSGRRRPAFQTGTPAPFLSSRRPRRERQVVRVGQLPGLVTRRSPGTDELPGARENLDAMVTGVGRVEVAVRSQGEGTNARELAGLRSRRTPAADELAVDVKLGD